LNRYASAFYFVTSTSTTVGYGDYFGTTAYERIWLIVMQFAGICIFSQITGSVNLYVKPASIERIINEKVFDINIYLQRID
jgi:hypothetical protein